MIGVCGINRTPDVARADMIQRRLDADDDEDRGASSGHGNTHIPYGLCKSMGIALPDKATPEQAWKALEGKGVVANDVYKYLDVHGTVKGYEPKSKTETKTKADKIKGLDVDWHTKDNLNMMDGKLRKDFDAMKERLTKPVWEQKFKEKIGDKWGLDAYAEKIKNGDVKVSPEVEKVVNSTNSAWHGVNALESVLWMKDEFVKNYHQNFKMAKFYHDMFDGSVSELDKQIDNITESEDDDIKEFLISERDKAKDFVNGYEERREKEVTDKVAKAREKRVEAEKERKKIRGKKRKTGIKQYEHFDSVDEVGENLRKNHGFNIGKLDDVPGMTVNKANQMSDALLTIRDNYGVTALGLVYEENYSNSKAVASWHGFVMHPMESNIMLHSLLSVDKPGMNYANSKKFKRWSVDRSSGAVIVHELGHSAMSKRVYPSLAQYDHELSDWDAKREAYIKEYDDLLKAKKINMDDIEDLVEQWYMSRTEKTDKVGAWWRKNLKNNDVLKAKLTVDKAFAKAKQTGDIYKLSEYGSTDRNEFFAESFVAYNNGEKLPNYIVDMIEDFI